MRKEYKDNMPVPFSSLSKTGSEGEVADVEDLSFDIEARRNQALSRLKAYGISFSICQNKRQNIRKPSGIAFCD